MALRRRGLVVSIYLRLLVLAKVVHEPQCQQTEQHNAKRSTNAERGDHSICRATVFNKEKQRASERDKNTDHHNNNEEIKHLVQRASYDLAANQVDSMPPRTAEIKVTVELNDQNLPTGIAWQATEGEEKGDTACQAMMLSFWDSEKQAVAAIDLWTEEMTIEEMNHYFYQVIHKLADTYLRATKDDAIAREIHAFGDGFGKTSGVVDGREQST